MAKSENYSGSFERLLYLLEEYKGKDVRNTESSFQTEFGLSGAYFRTRRNFNTADADKSLTESTLAKIHKFQPNLNMDWLKYGEGEPWITIVEQTDNNNLNVQKEVVGRPYYNVDFLGGFDLMINDQTLFPEEYISVPPYDKDNIYWCNLTGDSMSPRIQSGAKICLKHIAEGVSGIIYGEVYALVTRSEMRTVKWVVRADTEDKIRLVPENKEPKYGDYQDILKSDVIQVFKVELAINPM
ncbi:S24 family peptidase [Prevotella disiens]|uniref:S24 family peptidase n=1 Tax=Prevotella disiens TaxID=28130 RepID=UPI00068B7F59|nr:S24 family peptidase [Prevotella disiens]